MKVTPLFDNVLVKPVEPETKTASGIIIPDTAKDKSQICEVKAVGKGKLDKEGKMVPMAIKVGQKVMCKQWGGTEVKMGTEEWKLMSQEDILAIVE